MALPEPWVEIDDERAQFLADELLTEVADGHALFGADVAISAQCRGCDNVLGRTTDGRWFVTHLTWSKPDRPPWPNTTIAGSHDAIVAEFDDHRHS